MELDEVSDILAALAYLQSRSLARIRLHTPFLGALLKRIQRAHMEGNRVLNRQFSSSLPPLRPETRPAVER